jgi:glutamate N-acetyltransferase/amino-acid N-acetyltransferase
MPGPGQLILMSAPKTTSARAPQGQAVQNMNLICGFDPDRRPSQHLTCCQSHNTTSAQCRVPFKIVEGGVTAAKGFRASAVTCGIKNPEATRLDLALIVSDTPTVTDAVFTTNKVRAACVRVCQQHIKESDTRAIIANSGNANACTGVQGIQDAKAMTKAVAEELGVKMRQVLVCSTGIIGMPMPIERILPKVPDAVAKLNDKGSDDAMRAIMTSDTRPKTFAVEVPVRQKRQLPHRRHLPKALA